MLEQILPFLLLFVVVAVFAGGLIGLTTLTGFKGRKTKEKAMPYECGLIGEDAPSSHVSVKFYLVAISFILFDIEAIFLYPWALIFRDNLVDLGGGLLISMGFFMAILVFGLFYEWRSGGLEWD